MRCVRTPRHNTPRDSGVERGLNPGRYAYVHALSIHGRTITEGTAMNMGSKLRCFAWGTLRKHGDTGFNLDEDDADNGGRSAQQ